MTDGRWTIAVDRGGTFTDVVARTPDGATRVLKVPTGSAHGGGGGGDAVVARLRKLLGVPDGERIPSSLVSGVRCGTTAATNALLERRGERCALLVTRGFADLLAIGTQERPDIFALAIAKTLPLAERVVEVGERVLVDGTVRGPLADDDVRDAARALRADGFASVAVLFLHAHLWPEHERRAGEVLRAEGIAHVTLSHEASRTQKAVPRGETACADAYLTPVLTRSLTRFREAFDDDVDVRFMQSHGGLADTGAASGPRAVLSGPAGGAVAVAAIARARGEAGVVGFDMGGTSTDVCRFAGDLERVYETRAAGFRLQVPALRIVTVAAGGGSVLTCDGRRLHVGPESAGAEPGPAGYGRGGPATVTDANAVLGRLLPERYPTLFGERGDAPFSVAASRRAIETPARASGLSVEAAALGFLRVANERMAQAIREVSVARGYDVREHALVCFGGAGGQHACAVARLLAIGRVIVPRHVSVLSAWGIGRARPAHEEVEAVPAPWDADGLRHADHARRGLDAAARSVLRTQGVAASGIETEALVELRHVGVDATLAVPLRDVETTLATFHEAHERLYGFTTRDDPVELVNVRVRAVAAAIEGATTAADSDRDGDDDVRSGGDSATAHADVWFEPTGPARVPVLEWTSLERERAVRGPLLVVEPLTTVVVPPDWTVRHDAHGHLTLEWAGDGTTHARDQASADRHPVAVALFANRFMSIAERMGAVLERVSHSTNIKERLDFSCALFDGGGRLVANAPHIPVHLGAMGESVRAIAEARGEDLHEGDALVTNDPYRGGSHLPDVTVVTPVCVQDGRAAFYVANRAHHADVGGVTPGSMPPLSTSIDEEGARIHDLLLVRDGRFDERAATGAFSEGTHPARGMPERISDLRAQVAANAEGARLLRDLCAATGKDIVAAHMAHVLDDGAAALSELIAGLPDGTRRRVNTFDDGTPLVVEVTVAGDRLVVDFAGTGPRDAGNLNAPRAVTRAAVLYALRTLVRRDVPLNEGCLRRVEIRIPDGCVLAPEPPDAVVGGNVETSMRVVDVVLGALGAVAASQGTMNNLTFGPDGPDGADARASAYYETICGGAGAGPDFAGADAVHTHMTNTRITDPEVLEERWPVVVRRFAVRRGSGGRGRHTGGDGVVREIEFLAPMRGGILSQSRVQGPRGLDGGGDGRPGRNVLVRDGEETELPGRTALELRPGDVLRIETPGGGGCGR